MYFGRAAALRSTHGIFRKCRVVVQPGKFRWTGLTESRCRVQKLRGAMSDGLAFTVAALSIKRCKMSFLTMQWPSEFIRAIAEVPITQMHVWTWGSHLVRLWSATKNETVRL